MKPIVPTTLHTLIEKYDVFFIDQFGVLRDDTGPYDGAIRALQAVRDAGKTIVILSNSGRSSEFNAARFVNLGFSRQSFHHFITSGDVAYALLSAKESSVRAGDRCLTISSSGDTDLADRLGLVTVHESELAEVIIISGSQAEFIPMDTYRDLLRPAAKKKLPCFCTNPDIHKLAGSSIAPGAGSIAKIYEELGGQVRWLGKPHPEIYDYALAISSTVYPAKVVCIGDSIEHDILGAKGAGLDSVLVDTGIHAGQHPDAADSLMNSLRAWPKYRLKQFVLEECDDSPVAEIAVN